MSEGPDWVEQTRRLVAELGQTLGEALRESARDGGHPADCRWCPVCQVAAVVRGERPEVTAALADVLGAASAALRSFAEAAPAGREDGPAGRGDGPVGREGAAAGREERTPPPPAAKPSPVQRVEIA